MESNRRDFIKKSTSISAAISFAGLGACTGTDSQENRTTGNNLTQWPVLESTDTPKLCMYCPYNAEERVMRRIKQIGVDYVLMGGPGVPWTEDSLRSIIDRFKANGLTIINMMIYVAPNIIYGWEGRDIIIQQVQDSIRAAGLAGLPVVEYNFYAHRLIEGYYRLPGRGGVDYLAYDYNRTGTLSDNLNWWYPEARKDSEINMAPQDLPPLPEIGIHSSDQLWDNITFFLKAVIPVAEKAGVRMALHPNDPPVPVSRGSQQIMTTFSDWKRLVNIVDSPSNGMTFDCGVSNEIGEDPLEGLDYFASRDRLNHVHYRNCIVETPGIKYVEVFPDNGSVNMFEVMRQLVQRKYKLGLYAEHPRVLDYDKEHPEKGDYAGWVYNIAYARAMMQAVMSS